MIWDSVSHPVDSGGVLSEWEVFHIGPMAVAIRRERNAVFSNANGYLCFWKCGLPSGFPKNATIVATPHHNDSSSMACELKLKVVSLTDIELQFAFTKESGGLPSQVKLGFDIIAIGTTK